MHARKFVNETLTAEWRISAFPKLKKALKLVKLKSKWGIAWGKKM